MFIIPSLSFKHVSREKAFASRYVDLKEISGIDRRLSKSQRRNQDSEGDGEGVDDQKPLQIWKVFFKNVAVLIFQTTLRVS